MKWHTEYLPVKSPTDNKRGWKFPYNGDDWPEADGWYWVWAGTRNNPAPSPHFTTPSIAWWDSAKGRFLAQEGDVYAWRKSIRRS
jgi:hypothetical protein